MNYDTLLQQRMDRFFELLQYLPAPADIPAELLVLSAGDTKARWSHRHVAMPGATQYFIFRKAGLADGLQQSWECVDRELNEAMQSRLR